MAMLTTRRGQREYKIPASLRRRLLGMVAYADLVLPEHLSRAPRLHLLFTARSAMPTAPATPSASRVKPDRNGAFQSVIDLGARLACPV